jgi:hypothetical protein
MKSARKLVIAATIVGLVLLVGAIIGAFTAQANAVSKPQPSPTPEVLGNGWYRYTDREAGYSISYPSVASLTVSDDVAFSFNHIYIAFPPSSAEYQGMQIIVYSNSERLSPDRFVQQHFLQDRLPQQAGADVTHVQIAGLEAAKIQMDRWRPAVVIAARNRVYVLSLATNMISGNPPAQAAIEMFYTIIDTFRLI